MTSKTKKLILQFCAYAAVGGISVICEWTLFAILSFAVRWHYIDAVIVSFTTATILNLILGKKFPFRASKIGRGKEAMMIFFVSVGGLGLNIILMAFFISTLHWHPFVAKVFASGIVFCWNYASRKFIIYRDIVYVTVEIPPDEDAISGHSGALPMEEKKEADVHYVNAHNASGGKAHEARESISGETRLSDEELRRLFK